MPAGAARKTVSLVLGSGGARGLAHIGVIQWLEEQGLEIASISGASMGSLVGGIYAAGELDAYRHWVTALERTDVLRFLDLSFRDGGLIKGDRIIDTLRKMVGEHAIEDLPISYTAVATDIERQREVWITRGPLFDAIRASIAVPSVFTPHDYLDMKLLDGGLLNPVPIAPTFKDRTDLTIAVNLNGQRLRGVAKNEPESKKPAAPLSGYHKRIQQFLDSLPGGSGDSREETDEVGVFDLLNRSFETMQNAIAAVKLAAYQPDIVIEIPRDTCASFEFFRAKEVIEVGYQTAAKVIPRKLKAE
jgi:NTE family protein